MKNKVYQIITDRIIGLLEQGTVPWQKPWSGNDQMPINLSSKKQYRGINVFLLAAMGYESPYWLTFLQAKKLGGTITKGEKACPVVFWKWLDPKDKQDGKGLEHDRRIPMLRYYSVFNVAQCEGIDDKVPLLELPEHDFNPIEDAEQIVSNMPNKPELTHKQARAFYRPSQDLVNMPRPQLFESDEEYYSTLFHELVHSTGHASRLNRFEKDQAVAFGSHTYSKEELVAEMGSAFLCNTCGIAERTLINSAAYIAGWLKRLKDDTTFVVRAAAQAQKAVDYIHNNTEQESEVRNEME